jgi:hypothetical protein
VHVPFQVGALVGQSKHTENSGKRRVFFFPNIEENNSRSLIAGSQSQPYDGLLPFASCSNSSFSQEAWRVKAHFTNNFNPPFFSLLAGDDMLRQYDSNP